MLFNESVKFWGGQSISKIPKMKNKKVKSDEIEGVTKNTPDERAIPPPPRTKTAPKAAFVTPPLPPHTPALSITLMYSADIPPWVRHTPQQLAYSPPGRPFKGNFCHWFWVSRVKDRRRRIGLSRDSVVRAPLSISLSLASQFSLALSLSCTCSDPRWANHRRLRPCCRSGTLGAAYTAVASPFFSAALSEALMWQRRRGGVKARLQRSQWWVVIDLVTWNTLTNAHCCFTLFDRRFVMFVNYLWPTGSPAKGQKQLIRRIDSFRPRFPEIGWLARRVLKY